MLAALRRAWGGFRSAGAPLWRNWNVMHRLQAAYEAAMHRDDLWTLADFKDADATLLPEFRRRIRSRARYEYQNNPLLARIIDVFVGDVCGEAGPALQIHSGDTTVDRWLEARWDKWWRISNQADKLRLGIRADAIDGEAVGVLFQNDRLRRRQAVGVDVSVIESDRVADPDWRGANRSDYIDGVHLDPETREPVGYDILKAHPGTEYLDKFGDMFQADYLPRARVLHAFRRLRPEQNRGVCRYVPALPLSGLHRKYMEAETNRNVLRAAWAFVIKSTAPPETEGVSTEQQWWQTINLPNRSGAGLFLPEQYDITQFRPDGSANEITAFHQIMGGVLAGCFTMPVGRALGVYTNSSYPGVRAEMQPYHRTISLDRYQVWEPLWLTPLYEAFLSDLIASPEWKDFVATLPDDVAAELDLYEIEWIWPERELVVDPSREEESRKKKMAMGLTDRGREMDSVDLEERDARAAHMLGVDVPTYRRMIAYSIFGVPPEAASAAAQPPDGESQENGEFGNLGRRQWQNNRKAIRDCLEEFISGTSSEPVTLQMLQSLGLSEARAQALIDDARDSVIDDPELQDAQTVARE